MILVILLKNNYLDNSTTTQKSVLFFLKARKNLTNKHHLITFWK